MRSDISDLIDAYLDGDISPAGTERLRAWLAESKLNVDTFAKQVFLHQQLRETLVAQNAIDCLAESDGDKYGSQNSICRVPAPAPSLSDDSRFILPLPSKSGFPGGLFSGFAGFGSGTPLTFFVILLSALVGGLASAIVINRFGPTAVREGQELAQVSPAVNTRQVAVTPVAYLASTNGCAWGGDSVKNWTVGHIVESGSEIALHEGIAEFRLANGVSLGVEGPASLLVVSPSKLALQYGKLTAHVPWGSEQFNLILPGYRVVTRDGELGVNVTPGKVALHVFSGEAHCSSILAAESKSPPFREVDDELAFEDDPDNQPAIIVGENQAVEIISEPGGRTTRRSPAADPQQFATKVSMSGRLPITEEYVKAVTRSRPVRYWRFEAVENGTIRNQVSNNGALKTTTEVSLSGNENNRVIELGRDAYVSGNLVASLPSSLLKGDSYSVEVWGKPSHYHHGCMVGMFQMNKQVSSLELMRSQTENRPATLRFYQRYDIQQDYKGAECFSSQIYNLRQWQHYVAVKEDDEMRLYINGVQVGKAKANAVALDRGGHLVVGRRFHTIPSGETRGMFVGQLDELAVYDRALSGQEITSHFRAVQFEQPAAVKLNTGQTSEQKSSKFNAF